MEYTSPAHKSLAPVDAYILQGPVSDRGAITLEMGNKQLEESVKAAKDLLASSKGHERMPLEYMPASFHDTPISVYRWNALAAAEYAIPFEKVKNCQGSKDKLTARV